MRALRSLLGILAVLGVAGSSSPAVAQPVGSEFQVNSYTGRPAGTTRLLEECSTRDVDELFFLPLPRHGYRISIGSR